MFGFLKRKKQSNERQPRGIIASDEQFVQMIDDEEIERRVYERLKYQKIQYQKIAQLKEATQGLLVLVSPTRGSIILGYPVSYFANDGEYWIYFEERPPSWLDSITAAFKKLFGDDSRYKVLKARKEITQFNDETITVYADDVKETLVVGILEAIPVVQHPAIPRGWDAYEAVKAERDLYREKFFELLRLGKLEVELALQMNPRVKTYWKELEKKNNKQTEELGGVEMEFIENPVKRMFSKEFER